TDADLQAISLRPLDAAVPDQTEFAKPPFQVFPRSRAGLARAAALLLAQGTEKDVPSNGLPPDQRNPFVGLRDILVVHPVKVGSPGSRVSLSCRRSARFPPLPAVRRCPANCDRASRPAWAATSRVPVLRATSHLNGRFAAMRRVPQSLPARPANHASSVRRSRW